MDDGLNLKPDTITDIPSRDEIAINDTWGKANSEHSSFPITTVTQV